MSEELFTKYIESGDIDKINSTKWENFVKIDWTLDNVDDFNKIIFPSTIKTINFIKRESVKTTDGASEYIFADPKKSINKPFNNIIFPESVEIILFTYSKYSHDLNIANFPKNLKILRLPNLEIPLEKINTPNLRKLIISEKNLSKINFDKLKEFINFNELEIIIDNFEGTTENINNLPNLIKKLKIKLPYYHSSNKELIPLNNLPSSLNQLTYEMFLMPNTNNLDINSKIIKNTKIPFNCKVNIIFLNTNLIDNYHDKCKKYVKSLNLPYEIKLLFTI